MFPCNNEKRPTVKGWQEYKGGCNSPIYGLPVPAGYVVIDLDTYKNDTLKEQVAEFLGVELDWEGAFLQNTKSGGEHYAFETDEVIRQGSDIKDARGNKIEGFDIRSAGKGYICSGEGYSEDLTEDAFFLMPELPKGLPIVDGFDLQMTDDGCSGFNLSDIEIQPIGLEDYQIKAYLDKLDDHRANNQDDWLKVGMGIHHETEGKGYALFDEFSKRSPDNYDADKNAKRWPSFGGKGAAGVTFATVIKMAGGRDVIATAETEQKALTLESAETVDDINKVIADAANSRMDALSLEVLLKKINAKYKLITGDAPGITAIKKLLKSKKDTTKTGSYVDDYVFITHSAEYMDRETKAVMGPRSFDVKHSRETPPNGDGEKQGATNFSNDIIQCVENSMYVPKFADIFNHNGLDYINLYARPELKLVDEGTTDIVERIKGHIAHMLPDEGEREIVVNYLAHNVQRPGEKIQWSIVLQGVQGDGKSLLAEMMQHVMGFANVRLLNVQTLESSFTGWSVGQCMTFIEELKLDNYRKYEILNNLKPYITNDVIECTKKGKDPQVVVNTTNYFALTNFKDALPIDDNDRRWCILFSQWQSGEALKAWMADGNQDYYSNLYTNMRENIGEIASWLLNHKIPASFKAMKRAPETVAKERMKDLTKSDAMLLTEDAINEFWCDDINDQVVNITKLTKEVTHIYAEGYDNWPKNSAIKNVMIDMGYHNIGRYKDDDRKNQTIYCKDDQRKPTDFK